MALRARPYSFDQSTLDIGSDTFKLARNDTGLTEGLRDFSQGATSFALDQMRVDNILEAKAKQADKVAEGLSEHYEFEKLKGFEAEAFRAAQLEGDPSGKGFTDQVMEATDRRIAEYVGAATTNEQRLKRLSQAEGLRTGILKQSVNHETNLVLKGVAKVREETYTSAGGLIGQMPNADGFALSMEMITRKADELNLSPRAKEAWVREGKAHLERQALAGQVALRPDRVLAAGTDIYAGMPTATATEEQSKIVRGAQAAGTDPKLMLAVGNIESRFDRNVRPIGKDGRPMSSAKGVFQTLDKNPYGVTDWQDTEGNATKLGLFFNRHKERLESQGIPATPGRLFMYHNVGQGVADRLQTADPNKTMGQVLFEVYGDTRMPDGQLWRDVVGRNNPKMYNPGMTVAQVHARYEKVLGDAYKAAEGVVSGVKQVPDEVARTRMSELLGFPVEHANFNDLNKAIGLAQRQLEQSNKEKDKFARGHAFVSGFERPSPNDPTHQKDMDSFVREQMPEFYSGIVQGTPAAYAEARTMVRHTNYVPKPIVEGARELIHSTGDPKARGEAFNFLADIYRNNTVAWDASKIDSETEKRVKEFIARTDSTQDAQSAIRSIDFGNSPEGMKRREALKAKVEGKGEKSKLTYDDFARRIAGSWVINRTPGVSDRDFSDETMKEMIAREGRDIYERLRVQDGKEPEQALKEAAVELARTYSVSNTLTGTFGRGRLMRHAPEKYYNTPTLGMEPFETQAKEIVWQEFSRKYAKQGNVLKDFFRVGLDGSATPDMSRVEIRVIPTARTDTEAKTNGNPSYQIWYRDPVTGIPNLAYMPDGADHWTPNRERMQQEDREAWMKGDARGTPTQQFQRREDMIEETRRSQFRYRRGE